MIPELPLESVTERDINLLLLEELLAHEDFKGMKAAYRLSCAARGIVREGQESGEG